MTVNPEAAKEQAPSAGELRNRLGFPVVATGEVSCIIARQNLAALAARLDKAEAVIAAARVMRRRTIWSDAQEFDAALSAYDTEQSE